MIILVHGNQGHLVLEKWHAANLLMILLNFLEKEQPVVYSGAKKFHNILK